MEKDLRQFVKMF